MKTTVKNYNKNMIEFVERVINEPSQSMLEVYEAGTKEALREFDFVLMVPLAIHISERYRATRLNVYSSRELELLVHDLHRKDYSKHEMLMLCQMASCNANQSRLAAKLFAYMTGIVAKIIAKRGDIVFKVGESHMCFDTVKPQPKLTGGEFLNN